MKSSLGLVALSSRAILVWIGGYTGDLRGIGVDVERRCDMMADDIILL